MPHAAARRARLVLAREFLGDSKERVVVVFMDRQIRRIAVETMWHGSEDRCRFQPAEVVQRASALGASGIVVAHNHPSGDPNPSAMDVAATYGLLAAANSAGIEIFDHLIVADDRIVSLRERGLM